MKEAIKNLKQKHQYRKLRVIEPTKIISFADNDYLGLADNPKLKKAAIAAIAKYGTGAKSSRYLGGNSVLHDKLENEIAQLKKTEAAIIFGSGYLTAIGVIPALVGRGDLIVADRLIHSCLIDGAILSRAKLMRFAHNSLTACEEILKSSRANFKRCLIITETVFSMDGDLGCVAELLKLAKKYDCLLLSDDAHGLGFVKSIPDDRHLQSGTLSKAAGSYGGYLATNALIIDFLRNFAKSAIYSTALPASVVASGLAALKLIKSDPKFATKALDNARLFCKLMNLAEPQSPIVVLILNDNRKVLLAAEKMEQYGFLISAVRPPTVETARLRISFSSRHTKTQVKNLAAALKLTLN